MNTEMTVHWPVKCKLSFITNLCDQLVGKTTTLFNSKWLHHENKLKQWIIAEILKMNLAKTKKGNG